MKNMHAWKICRWKAALFAAWLGAALPGEATEHRIFVIDRMDTIQNALRGRCAVYRQPPDRILFSKGPGYGRDGGPGLRLSYHKINIGGAYGQGGWIGYYTILQAGDRYFDASGYTHLTFWIRGEQGGERLQVGLADRQLAMVQDSVKSRPIEDYLPAGRVTTGWQKAVVPLTDMFVDYASVASVSLCFESELFDEEEVRGTIYVDDLAFEENPEP